ncbi:uncharacterized protein LOC135843026 [Planococcus citri]|uniref:uncharacterized protein LOC135843026 n=1 Tax=Planococcus citri TaxID=170843 RepID=UPI0031F9B7E1
MDSSMMKWFIIVPLIGGVFASDYYVNIIDDGPVVVGANITFSARLYLKGGKEPEGTYKFKWKDNAEKQQHHGEYVSNNSQSNWTVSYSPDKIKAGSHQVEVEVFSTLFIIDWSLCSRRKSFELTSYLNGEMTLKQNGTSSTSDYISNATEVKHHITLHQPDANYIADTDVTTHWYLDCKYIGKTNDMALVYNYTTSDVTHTIVAIIIASHDSNNTSTNYTRATTTSNTESSTELILMNSTNANDAKSNNTEFAYLTVNEGVVDNSTVPSIDFNCSSNTFSPLDNRSTYGLFSRQVKVKAPISNFKVEGNNWLQHGDLLNLQVWCNGSAPFSYCVQFHIGNYSISGNESCSTRKKYLSACNFEIPRYFGNSTNYTVVIIVENDVQKVVRGVNVNVYEVTKHPQISVIIVPVAAAIVAIILIIFGVAFYVQSRHRYIVEVADFDFSNASDMEYKTFRERLVEAVSNAFNKTEDFSEQDSTNAAPASKKYGSMQ